MKARLQPHREAPTCKARAGPQTAEALLRYSKRSALQGPCCEERSGTKAQASRMRVPQTPKKPRVWAGETRGAEQLLLQSRGHPIRVSASEDWHRRQDPHGKDTDLLISLLQTAVRAYLSRQFLDCGYMQLSERLGGSEWLYHAAGSVGIKRLPPRYCAPDRWASWPLLTP